MPSALHSIVSTTFNNDNTLANTLAPLLQLRTSPWTPQSGRELAGNGARPGWGCPGVPGVFGFTGLFKVKMQKRSWNNLRKSMGLAAKYSNYDESREVVNFHWGFEKDIDGGHQWNPFLVREAPAKRPIGPGPLRMESLRTGKFMTLLQIHPTPKELRGFFLLGTVELLRLSQLAMLSNSLVIATQNLRVIRIRPICVVGVSRFLDSSLSEPSCCF